ncbi:hypothetical protein NQD34_001098 [Periophthalmus magnuspinnatus]|nr:hypothetical protein NQD34_001098 [Periophthalmus magnuspinnatus]
MPLPDSVLARLPVVQVRAGSFLLQEGLQCRLCLQSFNRGQRLSMLPCHHKFHAECVDGIMQMTNACPLDGFVIYNSNTKRVCEKKTNSKPASPSSRYPASQTTGINLQDLVVPGVALLEKKHQLEQGCSLTSIAIYQSIAKAFWVDHVPSSIQSHD